ncbi:MAG: hypothetical protein R3F20_05485 [Planctomycetota bacterium]
MNDPKPRHPDQFAAIIDEAMRLLHEIHQLRTSGVFVERHHKASRAIAALSDDLSHSRDVPNGLGHRASEEAVAWSHGAGSTPPPSSASSREISAIAAISSLAEATVRIVAFKGARPIDDCCEMISENLWAVRKHIEAARGEESTDSTGGGD